MSPPDLRSIGEAALWCLPAAGAARLFARGARGARATWGLVSLTSAAIALDHLVDIQIRIYRLGKMVVAGIDPEERLRGEHLWMRLALMAALFGAAVLAIAIFLRLDRAPSGAKRLSLVGLVLALGYLAARQIPSVQPYVAEPRDLIVKGAAWLAVVAGILRQDREHEGVGRGHRG